MGGSRFGADDWKTYASYSADAAASSVEDTFTAIKIDPLLDPKGVKVRESRDSDANPQSTAIILDVDVTGSMGMIAHEIVKNSFGVIMKEVYDRKPVTDPHIMFMANGDVYCDDAPLQVSQFEADIKIVDQLKKVWVEGGGGGNVTESYDFPWYFAAMHTSIDCWEKRQKKGFLFTIGDEESPAGLSADNIEKFLGYKPQQNYSAKELLEMAERTYHVFHIIVAEGSHARACPDEVRRTWSELMGQRALWLPDYTKLGELVISTMEVVGGKDLSSVASSWDGSTALVVQTALNDLAKSSSASDGIAAL